MRNGQPGTRQTNHTPITPGRAGQPTAERRGAATTGDILSTSPADRRVPRKWRWHRDVLLALQSRLLRERAASLGRAAEPIEAHSMSLADSATDEFDHNLALCELSAEQDALYEVEQALHRIVEGSYGVCEETGQPIPAARLKAIPWTRFARAVEERLEREGVVTRTLLGKAASVRPKK